MRYEGANKRLDVGSHDELKNKLERDRRERVLSVYWITGRRVTAAVAGQASVGRQPPVNRWRAFTASARTKLGGHLRGLLAESRLDCIPVSQKITAAVHAELRNLFK